MIEMCNGIMFDFYPGLLHVLTDHRLMFLIMTLFSRFWLGVELDHACGKNDGSKSGVRYFKCRSNHGVFVLPTRVKR